ncbi:MAG: hypothetical protein K9K93_07475 [Acholeplasmataceae bacterium]|nr:hypothetical protein [Acholeplasmataceae bacterium]
MTIKQVMSLTLIAALSVLLGGCGWFKDVTSVRLSFVVERTFEIDEDISLDGVTVTVVYDRGDDEVLNLGDSKVDILSGVLEVDSGGQTMLKLDTTTLGDYALEVSVDGVTHRIVYTVVDTANLPDPLPGDEELPDPPAL